MSLSYDKNGLRYLTVKLYGTNVDSRYAVPEHAVRLCIPHHSTGPTSPSHRAPLRWMPSRTPTPAALPRLACHL
ncbi:MAG: hypothetical protein ACLTYN_14795 [Dysosmobacter welbionis]